ncbi:iron hydrogenase small subunit [Miniphocaeibacter halophilus]|uniref:Iron hydrogenase small subunit n=2 Tax=Miniphocaeibacter halophilus TaxID=2931922 RepID=A0AC61MTM1_9FIRM|nr:NADH-dependent [FeFe] hydrogenase, group A6 [Miniphocaeibacter halophilus]QQK09070.1 iron hydrogenase small subunit [Miniphocaeibacter halophilus]
MVNVIINGHNIAVEEGTTILSAAKRLKIKIPTLCHLSLHEIDLENKRASCRVCMVEVVNTGKLVAACATPVFEGMEIKTESARAIKARRAIVELLLSNHPTDCLVCAKNMNCELQKLASDLGIRKIHYKGERSKYPVDVDSLSIMRDPNKCILCKRCETVCNNTQTVGALATIGRGFNTYVGSTFDKSMYNTTCTFCGQCVAVCPTGALTEINNIGKLWRLLHDDSKHVIVQTAPAIRVAIGEEFGFEAGTDLTGKMVTALKNLGFDRVFDTNFAADLTVMEEANEFANRLKNGGKLPILTSCCPSWVNFMEQQFPDMLDIPSTCKSPHEMFGTIAKTYYAKKMNINPEDIVVVSVMPCVAKKYESARPELMNEGKKDVDVVITTRELAIMLKEAGISFDLLEEDEFDNIMGESSGAGAIFGSTGGVIEATVRTAYEWLTGQPLGYMEFTELRGIRGIKTTEIDINGRLIRIAVANGLGNTRRLLDKIRKGEEHFDAIEVMACPGGCIGGAGQPYHYGDLTILRKRAEGIYKVDRDKNIRKAHENPMIKKLYDEFLESPGSEKAEELLHTSYRPKPRL